MTLMEVSAMKPMRWMFRLPILFAVLFLGGTGTMAKSNQPQVASALFSEFETVFYVKADLLVGSSDLKGLAEQSANGLRVPFGDLLGALESLGKPVPDEIIGNASAVLVGAKDFRPPAQLGAVRSQLCYVVVLSSDSRFDLEKLASKSLVISSAGNSTWKWTVKPTEGQREGQTFYATQVAHSYLLVSNDANDLATMTLRLVSGQTQTVPKVRDWDSISQHALWGYRRYQQTTVNDRDADAAGLTDVSPSAQALVFFLDSENKSGILRLLATDDSTAEKINAAAKLPLLKKVSSDVWQTTIGLRANETSSEQMVVTMWLFGFGLYL